MVNSIARTVQSLIDSDPSLQDAIQRGYANYSAIARILRPRVEEITGNRVKLESIITSVRRAKVAFQPTQSNITGIIAKSTINVRTDVAKISVEKTRRALEAVRRVLADSSGEFLQVLEGTSAVTIIFDQRLFNRVAPLFQREHILDEKRNLAAVIVHSPREIINTPGCAIAFYNPVSRKGVNIEETMSCFTDTIIVLRMEDVVEAFNALTDMISEARARSP
ncbi:MAG: hypothetical protein ACE5Z5_10265 [Candidatus Bathyarchaeia archaeon]